MSDKPSATVVMAAILGVGGPMIVFTAFMTLIGCATKPAQLPPPAPVSAPTCLPMRSYTKAEQDAARAQLQTIPADSQLARWAVDYEALRDANRAACAAK